MKQLITILILSWAGLASDAFASIVNDPVALEAKLEEMRIVRMAKEEAKAAYWADYRKNQEAYQVKQCTRVYTNTGMSRKCKMITDYRYTGSMEYPR